MTRLIHCSTGPEAMEIVRKEYLRLRDRHAVPP